MHKQETVDLRVSGIVPQTCYDNYAGMINVGWTTKQTRMTTYLTIGYRRGRAEHQLFSVEIEFDACPSTANQLSSIERNSIVWLTIDVNEKRPQRRQGQK